MFSDKLALTIRAKGDEEFCIPSLSFSKVSHIPLA